MKNDALIHTGRGHYLLIGAVAIAILMALAYSHYSSSQMINKYAPLVDATMEIKVEITHAHLWLEELIVGDRYESFEDITKRIGQARWYQ